MNSRNVISKCFVVVILPLTIAVFTSCEKEQQGRGKQITFNVSTTQETSNVQSKASFGDVANGYYPITWENGDQIKVSVNGATSANGSFVGTVSEVSEDLWNGTLRATLTDDNTGSYVFTAVYPADNDITGANITVPTTQAARVNAPAKDAIVLTATSETYGEFPNEATLNFVHQTAYGKFVFSDMPLGLTTVEKMVITADQNIAGSSSSPSKVITLTNPDVSQPVWFGCLPAVNVSSITIKIVTATNSYTAEILSSYYDKTIAFTKGNVSEIPVDMSKVQFQEGEISRGVQIRLKEANKSGGTVNPVTANGIGVEWSISNFQSLALDAAQTYTAALYSDATCKNCVVSWDFLANGGNGTKGGNTGTTFLWNPSSTAWSIQHWAGFFFSGLTPATTYYVKVTAGNGAYGIKEVTTEVSQVVTMPATAAAGTTILYEDFGEIIWGGEPVIGLAGYSSTQRGTLTSMPKATGADPYASDETLYLVASTTNMGLFSTIGSAVVGSNSRLKEWGQVIEDAATNALLVGPGYVKCGASSNTAEIVTPPLSALTGTATVKLTVSLAPYRDALNTYDTPIYVVEVIDGGTFADTKSKGVNYNYITGGTRTVIKKGTAHTTNEWKNYSFTIENATPTSRIAIGTYRPDGETAGFCQHRIYVDNIQVTIVSYN